MYEGVIIKFLWIFKSKFLEIFLYIFVGVIYVVLFIKLDIIYIYVIGFVLFVFFVRLFGLKVVVIYYGVDYDRKKWNKFVKFVLKLGEKMGVKFSNLMIVVGNMLIKRLKYEYIVSVNKLVFIFNGILMGFVDNVSEEYLFDDILI